MADQKTIEQRVKEIIVNQLNVNEEQITPTASFLDDLGAEQRKAGDDEKVTWAQETLYVILEERISNALPTIYTTNLSPDELRAHLGTGTAGQRLWGRLERVQVMPAVELVQVKGKHRRNIGDKDTLIRRRAS